MIKWAPLSRPPRGVYLGRTMETLTDNTVCELKNSLNNCLGGGQRRVRALVTVTWDHRGERMYACDKINVCLPTRTPPEQSSVIGLDNMGDLPSGSFNDSYSDDSAVFGHNMVKIYCFTLEEFRCTHYLQQRRNALPPEQKCVKATQNVLM